MSETNGLSGKKLWFDVSTMVRWVGKPTGIPRVINALMRELHADPNLTVRLCRFDSAIGEFLEVDLAAIEKLQAEEPGIAAQQTAEKPVPLAVGRIQERSIKGAARGLFRRFMLWLPEGIQPAAKHLFYAWVHLLKTVRLEWRKKRGKNNPPALPVEPVVVRRERALVFGRDDILLSLGASWGDDKYSQMLDVLKRRMGFQVLLLIYDLIPCKFPHLFGPGFAAHFQTWTVNMLWNADVIATISRHSRRDILAFAAEQEIPCPPVEVIRLGDDVSPTPSASRPAGFAPNEKFILCVGTVEVRKNHLMLYQVWTRLAEEYGPDIPPLVIVGRLGWLAGDLIYQIQNNPLTCRSIRILTDVSDADLAWMYQHCLFTVYPSHYEGWGLPINESLSHGKYCVVSNASAMPEVGGELVRYHDPMDFSACKQLIAQAMFDDEFRRAREENIGQNYQSASWPQAAASLLAILRGHLAAKPGAEQLVPAGAGA